MGFRDEDLFDDGDGGRCKVAVTAVSCSICLEVVTDNVDRSWAKLQCGHKFHLDCIGSAFNIKGAMQCPNCRKIEKGQWLYANGSRPLPEFSIDDWAHDEDLYDLNYSEMSVGIHWCPFTSVPSSFDEGEFPSSAYHDLLGHHAVFTEHTPASSTSHPCPYVTYFGPIHPSSSASSGSGSASDGFTLNNHWNSAASVPSETPNSYGFPSMDLHYHSWDHTIPFPASNRIGGSDQHLIPPLVTRRATRNNFAMPRAGLHPFILNHSSGSGGPSPITSSVLPTYPASVHRPHDHHQSYFQQSTNNPVPLARAPPVISPARISSNSHRGSADQVSPISTSSSDPSSGFYLFSSLNSTLQESDNPSHRDLFHYRWEGNQHQPLFPMGQFDRDSVWGQFRTRGAGSESGVRSGNFRQRHASDRMPSQSRS